MKNSYYYILILLLAFAASSCFRDDSSEGTAAPAPVVTGYDTQTPYEVLLQDFLHIDPTVENESLYDFYWLAYSTRFQQGTGKLPQADTLARTRAIDYKMVLTPGNYILVFNIVNKATMVTTKITADLMVSTPHSNGWYVLKTAGGLTDFDFVHAGGRTNDWIKAFNGASLEGNAVKAVFVTNMKPSPTAPTDSLYSAFFVASDQDVRFYRMDNGMETLKFEDMFFGTPPVKNPQNVLHPTSGQNVILVNDHKMYGMVKGGRFQNPPASPYRFSPVAAQGTIPFGFDEITQSVVPSNNGAGFNSIPAGLGNLNGDIVWATGFPGQTYPASGKILIKHTDESGTLYKVDLLAMGGWGTPVIKTMPVPAAHGLMSAGVIAGYFNADYVYYAKDNQIAVTDMETLPETPLVTLDAGETITCMQHVRLPDLSPTATFSCMAVASEKGGQYKVRFYDIGSTGGLTPSAALSTIEGTGKVASIIYMQQGAGARIY